VKQGLTAPSTLLLARPHPLMVTQIRSAIARIGYEARVVRTAEEITSRSVDTLAGAIISAASTSEMGASLTQVLGRLRDERPDLPIAITTLIPADRAIPPFRKTLEAVYGDTELVSVAKDLRAGQCSARKAHILIISHDDAAHDGTIDAALRKHFAPH
jgi:hypothetical protein